MKPAPKVSQGAFLIPYLIALVLEGIPIFYIELAIGQRLRRGSIGVWTAISPYLGGAPQGAAALSAGSAGKPVERQMLAQLREGPHGHEHDAPPSVQGPHVGWRGTSSRRPWGRQGAGVGCWVSGALWPGSGGGAECRLSAGLGCLTVSFLVSLYYNTVLTWVLWYLLNSFQYPLPWSSCPLDLNRTGFEAECQASSTVSYFWYRQTLNITADISDNGSIQWRLLACLAASWAVVYLCVIRGIESTGKAIYFTALFPYLVLTIFLIRGLTLPGAVKGLIYLFTPDVQVLQNPRVWLDAATQIFFSLSLALGGHIAFASYNPPRNNCEKDTVTIALVNSMTSLYASIAVFSVLGFKAANDHGRCLDRNALHLINEFDFPDQSISRGDYAAVLAHLNATQPERVARLPLEACRLEDFLDKSASGTGLAFIVFTEAILHMPGAPGWAVLFFSMLFTLGLSSMFGNMESIITPLLDMGVTHRFFPKEALTGLVCLLCFLLAICFTLQSGNYWLEVFDSYAAPLNLIIFAFLEVVGVTYVYGMHRFGDDIAGMTGRRPGLFWRVTWKVVSPLLLLSIFVAYVAVLAWTPLSYRAWDTQYARFPSRQEKSYPGWVQATCVLLCFLPSLWVPAVALGQLLAKRRWKQDTWQDRCPKLQDRGAS
ncbi:inactive sodium-dependent neutral amino acid transporter B(0)AT3 [Ursus maritimus]|uniref:Inactive sodium-dependent neutral amino acid transporter B(0)AT3 n=1 Tax=Ursus maritimus TaxID=29073 RepID=A0A8M1G188_URSMA|nr:inactive sodium-dependent neutral amino acid transporter B(0)AT3 [Ursus maritimus]